MKIYRIQNNKKRGPYYKAWKTDNFSGKELIELHNRDHYKRPNIRDSFVCKQDLSYEFVESCVCGFMSIDAMIDWFYDEKNNRDLVPLIEEAGFEIVEIEVPNKDIKSDGYQVIFPKKYL